MKIIVDGTAHDLTEVLNTSKLIDLLELKRETGLGMRTLTGTLPAMGRYKHPSDILEDEAMLQALIALVWLARRRAGERLTFEEAGQLDLEKLVFEVEDDDDSPGEVAADPTSAPTDSDRGDEPAATQPRKGSSKTSKRTSAHD